MNPRVRTKGITEGISVPPSSLVDSASGDFTELSEQRELCLRDKKTTLELTDILRGRTLK